MPTLNWIGKDAVSGHHQDVPFRLLQAEDERSAGDRDAGHLLVEGDNLLALKALLPYYAGEVKCIYIDPPYNTGNEGWAYNDNVNSPAIQQWLGETVGDEAGDLSRHDKWLCMMQPRLMLLHELLAADGSFWMSIDDNEVHHARALLDDIFGRQNFVDAVIWQKVFSPKNSAKYFSSDHDYILVYAKDKENWNRNLLPRSAEQDDRYSNLDGDERGPWTSSDLTARNFYSEGSYAVKSPSGRTIEGPPRGRYWTISEEEFHRLNSENRVWWGEDGSNMPRRKRFLSEVKDGVVPQTLWTYEEVGHTQEAKKELVEICDFDSSEDVFVTPKPTRLIQRILEIATDPGDLVLDSFAGTGTTGHAVLKQNAKDGGGRRFILVEMEPAVARNVCAERLRRAAEGYAYGGNAYDVLFEEKLGIRTFQNAETVLQQMRMLKKERAEDYDGFSRRVKDGAIMLRGKKVIEGRKEGLGGGFRYLRLGPVLMGADGQIRRDVSYEELARHVHYSETGRPLPDAAVMERPLIHAAPDGTAYYLLYNGVLADERPAGGNVLTRCVLEGLPAPPGGAHTRVVFGTACRLPDAALQARGVTFRQIPYQIRTS